jgi:predicted RNA-binding Zn-ribbon protein involved in translation (DUF1610 family)
MTETIETRWRCPTCGSDEVQALAWFRVNGETLECWDEGGVYWCPKCQAHYPALCEVNREGFCLMHDRPFTECLPKEPETAEQLSLMETGDAQPGNDAKGGAS